MGFQFVHIQSYARKADAAGGSVAFVLAEAARQPEACQHVAEPLPPTVVHGLPPDHLQADHDRLAAAATTTTAAGKTRRIRQDQHTLLTVVASHPALSEAVRADPAIAHEVEAWQARTLAWLRAEWGEQVVSVVRHDDEAHPHLHAFILPTADPELRAKRLQPGWAAKAAAVEAAKANGLDGKGANAAGDSAYKTALRAMQDRYHEAVGLACGLTRRGPGKRRLSRDQWQTERAAARDAAKVLRRADRARQAVQRAEAHVRARLNAASAAEATARAAATEAEHHRHEMAGRARQEARTILASAREERRQIIQAAESKADRLRGLGRLLGGLWSGFRGVEARLRQQADAQVRAAKMAATKALEQSKEAARRDLCAEMGDKLADAAHAARRAQKEAGQARERMERLEAEAAALRRDLAAERRQRMEVECQRERYRRQWAVADHCLSVLQAPLAAPAVRR